MEEFRRFENEEPKVYNFDYRQLRLSSEELAKVFKELQKMPEILPPLL